MKVKDKLILSLAIALLGGIPALAVGPTAREGTNSMPVLSARMGMSLPYADPDGGTMTFTLLSNPGRGYLQRWYWNGTVGVYTNLALGQPVTDSYWYYTATGVSTGSDSFTWQVCDGASTSGVATMWILLTTNSPISARASTNTTSEGSVHAYIGLDYTDPDWEQPKSVQLVLPPSRGTLEYNASGHSMGHGENWIAISSNDWVQDVNWVYTPSGSGAGTDSFQWRITDGIVTSDVVTLSIVINANTPPVAQNQSASMAVGSIRYGVWLSYTDPDWSQTKSFQLLAPPTRGTLEYSSGTGNVAIASNDWINANSWMYTPSGTGTGLDSFTWRMSDGMSTSGMATVSITLNANTAPTANPQSVDMLANTVRKCLYPSVTHSDSYQPMTYIVTGAPTNGVLQYLDGTNYVAILHDSPITQSSWYYTPTTDYIGGDSIRWRVSDGVATSSVAIYTLNITSNRAPLAKDVRIVGLPDSSLTVNASYTDPDSGQTWTASVVGNASSGNVAAAGLTFTYTPNPGFKGIDRFTYKVNDSVDDSNIATGTIQIRDANDHANNLVLIVVNDIMRPVISNEIDRLKTDLEADGYTSKIKDWHLSGSNSSNLWAYLRGEYDKTNQFLEGAILVGDVPKAQTYVYHPYHNGYRWIYTDLVYWNMASYQTNGEITTRHIWVTRMNADDTSWGTQDVLLRRALDANHYYRRGMSRLPFSAYVFDCFNTAPQTNTMLELWPAVFGGGGGDHSASYEFAPSRTDVNHAACDCFVLGGEVFNETSHGNANGYMEGRWFDKHALYRLIAQQRAGLIGSCTSGAFGGIVNNHIFTRGGGLILAVGGTDINYSGDFIINSSASHHTKFRARLKAGDSWGGACLYSYPFTSTGSRTVFYGDFSMRVMPSGSNEVPVITSFQAVPTSPQSGQPVIFSIAISDPDGNGAKSPYVPFRHQVEWFMDGYNYGRNNPTYTTNDNGYAGWTNQVHTFTSAGVYNVRVEVMDEWRAIGWKELSVTVNTPPVASNDAAWVMAGYAVTIPVLANDYDADGALTLDAVTTAPLHGTVAISGTAIVYTATNNAWTGTDTFVYRVKDGMNATASATVTVTVTADTAGPGLVSVSSSGDSNLVTVVFDEPVAPVTSQNAGNYAVNNHVTVSAAVLQGDGRTVKLTTTRLYEHVDYALTITAVCDTSPASNVVAQGTCRVFRYNNMTPGIIADYYEGSWNALPDFSHLTPKKSVVTNLFTIAPRDRDDQFAFRFRGFILLPTAGSYTFFTTSDDGSELYVDGVQLVDNDGLHGDQERSGSRTYDSGFHEILVTMFEQGGGQSLTVQWQGPGIDKQVIPASVLYQTAGSVVPADADGDGIADNWELIHFGGTNTTSGSTTNDADGDGLCDRFEYLAGTDPHDVASALVMSVPAAAPGGFAVRWQSAPGKYYSLHAATNLLTGFNLNLRTNIQATLPENVHTDNVEGVGMRFYRVSVYPVE